MDNNRITCSDDELDRRIDRLETLAEQIESELRPLKLERGRRTFRKIQQGAALLGSAE